MEVEKSYINLYKRLVGFMSLSSKFGISSNVFMDPPKSSEFVEKKVLGSDKCKGVTCEETDGKETISKIVTGKALKAEPLSSLQVLYFWNEEQLQFLLQDKRLVLFMADFGVGKTLMKKHKALSIASAMNKKDDEDKKEKVIYVSLAQAVRNEDKDKKCIDKVLVYKNPSVFDIANNIEFKNTNVQFYSLCDIITLEADESNQINIGEVVENFLRKHEDAHVFIDEFPLTFKRSNSDESFLRYLQARVRLNKYFWFTIRLCDVRNTDFKDLNENKSYYENFLMDCGFEIPILKNNMRNPSYILSSFDSIYGYNQQNEDERKSNLYLNYGERPKDAKMMVDKALLPPNTVQGIRTVVVLFQAGPNTDFKDPIDTLSYVLNEYFTDPNEPVVVLVTETKYFASQYTKFSKRIKKIENECNRTILVYPFKRTTKNPPEVISNVEEFIESPRGVFLTDAEAFNGMQARNVVVISDGKRLDRNYIMRANSRVVFILKTNGMDYRIVKRSDIVLDRTFLPKKVQMGKLRRQSNTVWLWQIPHGVLEENVRDHLYEKSLDSTEIRIEKLFYPPMNPKMSCEEAKNLEVQFVGFSIEVLLSSAIRFEDIGFQERNFWPPGWCSKVYKGGASAIIHDKRHRNFEFSIEPTWLKVSINRKSGLSISDIKEFVKSKVISLLNRIRDALKKNNGIISDIVQISLDPYPPLGQ